MRRKIEQKYANIVDRLNILANTEKVRNNGNDLRFEFSYSLDHLEGPYYAVQIRMEEFWVAPLGAFKDTYISSVQYGADLRITEDDATLTCEFMSHVYDDQSIEKFISIAYTSMGIKN